MIDTGLWVICEHDWYGSMSDMWTWLMQVYEWYVNMSDIILLATGEYGWYGSMDNGWLRLMLSCESHVSMIYTRVCELDCNVLRSGGGIMVKIYAMFELHHEEIILVEFGFVLLCFNYMVFNATVNNISVISRRSVLLVEETGVPGANHRPVASYWQIVSHDVVSSTPRLKRIRTHNVSSYIHLLHR